MESSLGPAPTGFSHILRLRLPPLFPQPPPQPSQALDWKLGHHLHCPPVPSEPLPLLPTPHSPLPGSGLLWLTQALPQPPAPWLLASSRRVPSSQSSSLQKAHMAPGVCLHAPCFCSPGVRARRAPHFQDADRLPGGRLTAGCNRHLLRTGLRSLYVNQLSSHSHHQPHTQLGKLRHGRLVTSKGHRVAGTGVGTMAAGSVPLTSTPRW